MQAGDEEWTRDETRYPAMRSVSPRFLFERVPVYRGPAVPLEFIGVRMPAATPWGRDSMESFAKMTQWNLQWEGGPYRAFDTEDLPAPLEFLRRLEAPSAEAASSDIVLLPDTPTDIYPKWEPIYHLLPRRTLIQRGLPVLGRGGWPMRGALWRGGLRPEQYDALSRAFAEELWRCGLGTSGSPLGAFRRDESLVLLAHDLGYWRAHLERLIRSMHSGVGRVPQGADDIVRESSLPMADLAFESPNFGFELWTGEEEAAEVTRDLIEAADENGCLRAVIDAIRSRRVEEDFSRRWSFAREDFERKLYRKRSRVRVSFVELDESIPFFDENTELQADVFCRDLLAVVDPKDRRVVVLLHSGVTNLADLAAELGYANHSPISKKLARIRKRAVRLLDD